MESCSIISIEPVESSFTTYVLVSELKTHVGLHLAIFTDLSSCIESNTDSKLFISVSELAMSVNLGREILKE